MTRPVVGGGDHLLRRHRNDAAGVAGLLAPAPHVHPGHIVGSGAGSAPRDSKREQCRQGDAPADGQTGRDKIIHQACSLRFQRIRDRDRELGIVRRAGDPAGSPSRNW